VQEATCTVQKEQIMPDIPPQGFTRLSGSERNPPTNAQELGPVDPNEHIEVSVYLRDPSTQSVVGDIGEHAQQPGQRMTRAEYAAQHSASPDDVAKVEAFARQHHLTVVSTDPVSRKVVLAGTAAAMTKAFATELKQYQSEGRKFRGRTGPLHIPNELDQVIVGIYGLDTRPQARPHYVRKAVIPHVSAQPAPYTPLQIAQLYDFPTGVNGSGQCIALIELGGGYRDQDLSTYFQQLGIAAPQVTSVSVDGAQNSPTGDPNGDDGEVALDIEVAGGVAPGAHVVVYFAPNSDQGFIDAVTQAVHDSTNNPSVISISWGQAESGWTTQGMQGLDQAFQAAAALGVTICCAAGDDGSSDSVNDQKAHVDFPASSSFALGCGGTRLDAANNQVTDEVVWNETATNEGATGGGISDIFGLPTWQQNAQVPPSVNDQHAGRGVPDVAGNADPVTGYLVNVDGQSGPIGGTSAVAPLWAGLIALLNQKRGKAVGYLNPFLYQNYAQLAQSKALRDVTSGNNGAYSAGPGWDACTGLGTPDGALLLQALSVS
jgi:kumamolisin